MFSYRIFEEAGETLLAIADKSIVGRTFTEGELSITISDFYAGKDCETGEALKLIKRATIINAVGKDIIALLVKKGLVDKNSVLKISGVPHAQIVTIKD